MTTRSAATAALAGLALAMAGCGWDGHFTVLGYTTRPNYDDTIKTVYVPVFKNLTPATTTRGMEWDLTRAVVREIEAKTPYKVVSDRDRADTELIGTVLVVNKNIINRTQLNEVREGETVVEVSILWRDLRTGEILSQRKPGPQNTAPPLFDPLNPPPEEPLPKANPVKITSTGRYIPELGESITTAFQQNVDRLAIQIVSMMERPW